MVSEWIYDSSEKPAMGVSHRHHFRCPCPNRLSANGCRIFHNQQHSNRAASQRFRAEVFMCRRFLGDPELRARHGQLADTATGHAIQFACAKSRLVEIHRPRPAADGQRGGNGCLESFG